MEPPKKLPRSLGAERQAQKGHSLGTGLGAGQTRSAKAQQNVFSLPSPVSKREEKGKNSVPVVPGVMTDGAWPRSGTMGTIPSWWGTCLAPQGCSPAFGCGGLVGKVSASEGSSWGISVTGQREKRLQGRPGPETPVGGGNVICANHH